MKLARTNIHLRRFRDLCCVSVVVWVRVVPFFNVDPGHEIHVSFQCIAKPNGLAPVQICQLSHFQRNIKDRNTPYGSQERRALCATYSIYIYISYPIYKNLVQY